jgi:hypothetical protein
VAGTRTSKAVTVTMTPTVALLALPRYESSLFLLRWFQFFHEREKDSMPTWVAQGSGANGTEKTEGSGHGICLMVNSIGFIK